MNNITKRVSMYIRVKPEFESNYDFKQIVIRLGYMEDPNYKNRPYGPRFIFSNFAIFLTEPNGKPHTYKHEIPVHEAWDYNRQYMQYPHALKKNLDEYVKKLPLYWQLLHKANVVQSRLQNIVDNMKYNANSIPWGNYDASVNHKYIEIKTALNNIAGFILDKEPRDLVMRLMETTDDIESIKVKVSDFDHTIVVDSSTEKEEEEEPAVEIDKTFIKCLVEVWEEQKTNLVKDDADNRVAVTRLMDNLSSTRRILERMVANGDNPNNAVKIKAIIPEIYKVETEFDKIKQKYASMSADRDAEMMEYMSVVFGNVGKELEKVLDMYLNPDKYSI